MRLTNFLTGQQVEDIHRAALRVLEDVGVLVEHEDLCRRLQNVGGAIDSSGMRVRFSRGAIERLIWDAPRTDGYDGGVKIGVGSGIYQSWYLDHETDKLRAFDEDLLARYIDLAKSSLGIDNVSLLGLPFVPEDIPASYIPLVEKLYAWKYGASPGGSVHFTSLCEPIIEMCRCHAGYTDKPVDEVFTAAGFMISPLKLARPECEQLLFFADRGFRMYIGHLPSQGGTAPVTLAGSLVLALAEQIFLFLLRMSLWGDTGFALESMVSTIDMRGGSLCYGRPEQQRTTLALADMASYYGCRLWGHSGLSDARIPSFEAGVQKSVGVLMTALATGYGFMEAGLLGTDEICSPVQMVLDCELAESLKALLTDAHVLDVDSAFEEIKAVGIGGSHLGTDSTVEHFRGELFMPKTWSAGSVSAWVGSGGKIDMDIARDIVSDFYSGWSGESMISEEEERELRGIINSSSASSG